MKKELSENILIIDFAKDFKILELTPFIHLLSAGLHNPIVTVAVRESARSYLDSNPYIQNLITIPDSFWAWKSWYHHLQKILGLKFDYIFCTDDHPVALLLNMLSHADQKYALLPSRSSFLPITGIKKKHHTIPAMNKIRLLDFMEILPGQLIPPEIYLNPVEKMAVESWMLEQGLMERGPFVCIAPGAKAATLCWLPERFAKLSDNLVQLGYPVVLVGESADYESGLKVESLVKENIINSIGLFSVRQIAYLISFSRIVISNDNVSSALASTSNVPNLVILGSSVRHFEYRFMNPQTKVVENNNLRCRPCSAEGRRYCPMGHFNCMRDLSVNEVFRPILELLKSSMF